MDEAVESDAEMLDVPSVSSDIQDVVVDFFPSHKIVSSLQQRSYTPVNRYPPFSPRTSDGTTCSEPIREGLQKIAAG
jgi:hypothetical protein